jgi:hypothetical protein
MVVNNSEHLVLRNFNCCDEKVNGLGGVNVERKFIWRSFDPKIILAFFDNCSVVSYGFVCARRILCVFSTGNSSKMVGH